MKKATQAISSYLRILEFRFLLRPDIRPVAALWLLRLAGLVAALLLPLLTRSLIDTAIGRRDWTAFIHNAVASLSIVLVSFAATVAASWYSTRVEETTGLRLRLRLQRRLEQLGVAELRRWSTGDQICLANSDADNVTHVLVNALPAAAITFLEFILFSAIAFRLDPGLTIFFSLSFPFIIAIELLHAGKIRPLQQKRQILSARVNEQIGEFTAGHMTLRAFAIERKHTRTYARVLMERLRQSICKWRVDSGYEAVQWLVQTGWGWAVLFYGFALVMRGELSLGTLLALKMYFSALNRPMDEATNIAQSVVVGSVSADRLLEVLNTPIEDEQGAGRRMPAGAEEGAAGSAGLVLENVSFAYRPDRPVLQNISAIFPGRKLIGITGPSGAGKTTLLGLIARLYRPSAGTIRIDGRDLSELTHQEVSSLTGVALQEAFLFPGTIYENISCGKSEIPEESVFAAARMAAAHDFILTLPSGYQTDVRSAGFSVGQKQRIGIARALVKAPPVLMLDEPTNALDRDARVTVLKSLREAVKRRLVILISHDPETLAACDEIFVISRGRMTRMRRERESDARFIEYLELKSVYEAGYLFTTEGTECEIYS